jgi:hypothetical protein
MKELIKTSPSGKFELNKYVSGSAKGLYTIDSVTSYAIQTFSNADKALRAFKKFV